jgi:AraC-like DNA-binding protein
MTADFSRHAFVPHTHETYAIGVVEGGAARTLHGGQIHVASAGSVMLINPGEVHTGAPVSPDSGWRYRMLYPAVPLVHRLCRSFGLNEREQIVFQAPVIDDHELAGQIVQLHASLERGERGESLDTLLRATFERLFTFHWVGAEHGVPGKTQHRAVVAAKQYLALRLRARVALEDIAAHVSLSPFYFTRLFRAHTGMAPYTWLEHERIDRAAKLLRAGVPISDVALETGFSDQSHLSRRFKRVLGVPPGRFVRAVRHASQPEPR